MKLVSVLRRPSAFLPVAMSFGHGPAPQQDEGAAAHIWQLLMAGQIPIALFFAIKWVPRQPRQAVPIVVLQVVAALAALVPVFVLHW